MIRGVRIGNLATCAERCERSRPVAGRTKTPAPAVVPNGANKGTRKSGMDVRRSVCPGTLGERLGAGPRPPISSRGSDPCRWSQVYKPVSGTRPTRLPPPRRAGGYGTVDWLRTRLVGLRLRLAGPDISPAFVARASRRRCSVETSPMFPRKGTARKDRRFFRARGGPHGLKERMRAAEGAVDTSADAGASGLDRNTARQRAWIGVR